MVGDAQASGHSAGTELKLLESSVEFGQMDRYARSPRAGTRMVYLTPFTRTRFPELDRRSRAIREFETFAAKHPERVPLHVSLLDVIELAVDVQEPPWPEFQEFVRGLCVAPTGVTTMAREPLYDFVGQAATAGSWQALRAAGITVRADGAIDVDSISDPQQLVAALEIVVRSEAVSRGANRQNQLTPRMQMLFRGAPCPAVHDALFALAMGHPGAWVAGANDYAFNLALRKHRSGKVSILQSDIKNNRLWLNHLPWVAGPGVVVNDSSPSGPQIAMIDFD